MSTSAKVVNIRSRENKRQRISPDLQLIVYVLFTSARRTLQALQKAGELAKRLGSGIVVVAVQPVPFPLPLDEPPVPFEFVIRRFEEMVGRFPENSRVSAYLCRDRLEALKQILSPNSPVVIGIGKKWWPGRDERLARKLRRAGYDVILAETE